MSTTPEPQVKPATEYFVLKKAGGSDRWDRWDVGFACRARSANAAIRLAVGSLDDDEQPGDYVAIPTRSWKPVKVTPKIETTLILEDA